MQRGEKNRMHAHARPTVCRGCPHAEPHGLSAVPYSPASPACVCKRNERVHLSGCVLHQHLLTGAGVERGG